MTVLPQLLRDLVVPVHRGLMEEFGIPSTREAACLSLAIKHQESGATVVRDQGDPAVIGPATGMWQFERMGGVWEILNTGKTKDIAAELCRRVGVAAQPDPVWRLFTTAAGDELACAFARMLTWVDPAALPPVTLSAEQEAYDYYIRRWRPGAKRRAAWQDSWRVAVETVEQEWAADAPPVSPPEPALPAAPSDRALEARVARLEARLDAMLLAGAREVG